MYYHNGGPNTMAYLGLSWATMQTLTCQSYNWKPRFPEFTDVTEVSCCKSAMEFMMCVRLPNVVIPISLLRRSTSSFRSTSPVISLSRKRMFDFLLLRRKKNCSYQWIYHIQLGQILYSSANPLPHGHSTPLEGFDYIQLVIFALVSLTKMELELGYGSLSHHNEFIITKYQIRKILRIDTGQANHHLIPQCQMLFDRW